MKIQVTIEIDRRRWVEEYGLDSLNIRADVISYVRHALMSSPAGEAEAIRDVSVR